MRRVGQPARREANRAQTHPPVAPRCMSLASLNLNQKLTTTRHFIWEHCGRSTTIGRMERGRNCAKYSNILLDSLPAREAWLLRPPLETLGSPFCAFSKTGISWHGVHWNSCGQIPQLACGSRFTPLFAEFHSGISSIHRAPGLRFLAQKKASSLCLGWAYEI